MPRTTSILVLVLILSAGAGRGQRENVERAAWGIWEQAHNGTNDPVRLRAACAEFQKAYPADPLAMVVRGVQAWSLLKTGERGEAVKLLHALLIEPRTATQRAAVRMARTWLTRVDREAVRAALDEVYRQQVEYPESLAPLKDLPPSRQPPLTDRWGKPWSYSLVGFKYLEGFNRQKYALRSPMLGEDSDLADALTIAYAARINVRPVRMTRRAPGNELILFETTDDDGERALLSLSVSFGDIDLAYIGDRILILSDGNHWKFTAKPR